jgi:hypothetical protein
MEKPTERKKEEDTDRDIKQKVNRIVRTIKREMTHHPSTHTLTTI